MELIKKNWLSIACGVVALIAIIAIFWPISGYYEQLRTEGQQRAALHGQLEGLRNKQRTLPVVPMTEEAQPLNEYPTAEIIRWGEELTKGVSRQSQELMQRAVSLNRRDLLVPNSLPNPSQATAFQFRVEYARRMNYDGSLDPIAQTREASIPVQILNAGFPPTREDITIAIEQTRDHIQRNSGIYERGQLTNKLQIDQMIYEETEALPRQMFHEAASKLLMYINPNALTVNQALVGTTATPDANTIFASQMQLWVQEEISRAMREINSESKDVMGAPIKHLIRLEVVLPPPIQAAATPTTGGGFQPFGQAAAAAPMAAPAPEAGSEIPRDFGYSPTGRVSNPLYDVVNTTVTLRAEADAVPLIVEQLGRNRLQMVTLVERIAPVDSSVEAARGFLYGTKGIVEVSIQMESLFLRDWTVQYMPMRIRQALGIVPSPEAAPQPAY